MYKSHWTASSSSHCFWIFSRTAAVFLGFRFELASKYKDNFATYCKMPIRMDVQVTSPLIDLVNIDSAGRQYTSADPRIKPEHLNSHCTESRSGGPGRVPLFQSCRWRFVICDENHSVSISPCSGTHRAKTRFTPRRLRSEISGEQWLM